MWGKNKAGDASRDSKDRVPLIEPPNSNLFHSHSSRQQDLFARQEDVLLDMQGMVGRLTDNARVIGNELETHNKMLAEMDDEMDKTQETMNVVEMKLNQMIEKSGRSHFCIIMGLLGLIFFLLFLIIYT